MSIDYKKSGLVLQIGPAARAAAEHVARTRSLPCLTVASVDEARPIVSRARDTLFVVIDAADCVPDTYISLSDCAARSDERCSLGFIYGYGSDGLLSAARRLSVSPSAAPSECVQVACATSQFSPFVSGARLRIVPTLDAVPDVPDVLWLVGHSNGHDAGAGRSVFCRRPAREHDATSLGVFPCFHGADCRFAADDVQLFHADSIRARRVIALVCWGVSLPGTPFELPTTIGAALLGSDVIETLVTLVRAAFIGQEDFASLYYACNDGMPLGLAATVTNKLRLRRGERADIICFGDPDTSIVSGISSLELTRDGDVYLGLGRTASTRPTDAKLEIAEDIRRTNHDVAILSANVPIEGPLLSSDDTLYFSILEPYSHSDALVQVTLVDSAQVDADYADVQPALADVTAARLFVASLSESLSAMTDDGANAEPMNEYVLRANTAVFDLEDLIRHWPTMPCLHHSVVSREQIESASAELMEDTQQFAQSLIELWRLGSDARVSIFEALDRTLRLVDVESAVSRRCPYCGGTIDERLRLDLTKTIRRPIGRCQNCQCGYEGDSELGGWLECDVPLAVGGEAEIRVRVRNAYARTIPAQFMATLTAFGTMKPAVPKQSDVELIEPGETATLKIGLGISDVAKPGLYELAGIVVVGTSYVLARRLVTVAG